MVTTLATSRSLRSLGRDAAGVIAYGAPNGEGAKSPSWLGALVGRVDGERLVRVEHVGLDER